MRALLLFASLGLAGCMTPSYYDVHVRDPAKVTATVTPYLEETATLDPTGRTAEVKVEAREMFGATFPAYATRLERADDGSVVFRFVTSDQSADESAVLLGADGRTKLVIPTAEGGESPPGFFHGVMPLSRASGQQGYHVRFRPTYEIRRDLGQDVHVDISLWTPNDNVVAVVRQERPPRTLLWMGVAIATAMVAGGSYIAYPDDRGGQGLRYGIGLPLVGVGLLAGGWSTAMLLRDDRSVPIRPDDAHGRP